MGDGLRSAVRLYPVVHDVAAPAALGIATMARDAEEDQAGDGHGGGATSMPRGRRSSGPRTVAREVRHPFLVPRA